MIVVKKNAINNDNKNINKNINNNEKNTTIIKIKITGSTTEKQTQIVT